MDYPLIVITGPTATGKTKLAVAVAGALNAEIINADSRQVYRQMDIGTGKDLQEYIINNKNIPYHLIDICEPGYQYNIKEYQEDFTAVYASIKQRQVPAILCGGSGLYIESALEGNPFAFVAINKTLRERLTNKPKNDLLVQISSDIIEELNITKFTTSQRMIRAIEITNAMKSSLRLKKTTPLESLIFVIELERAVVMERIINRLKYRLEHGLIEEIEQLLKIGITEQQLYYYGLEYRWVTHYLLKKMTYDEMFERLNISIRQFAKRQMTWFRRMERKGYKLNWLDGNKPIDQLRHEVINHLNNMKGS